MEVRSLRFESDGVAADQEFGWVEVGRGANKSSTSRSESEYQAHLARLEAIRLTGYKFLKPPGVTKTLKNIHEEEAFDRELESSSRSNSVNVDDQGIDTLSQTGTPRRENSISGMQEDEQDSLEFTNDISIPAMDASFPSIYHSP